VVSFIRALKTNFVSDDVARPGPGGIEVRDRSYEEMGLIRRTFRQVPPALNRRGLPRRFNSGRIYQTVGVRASSARRAHYLDAADPAPW
jgi:hypothetical protein